MECFTNEKVWNDGAAPRSVKAKLRLSDIGSTKHGQNKFHSRQSAPHHPTVTWPFISIGSSQSPRPVINLVMS
jgi:hypothetical protein